MRHGGLRGLFLDYRSTNVYLLFSFFEFACAPDKVNTMKIQIGGLSEGIHRYHFQVASAELELGEHFADDVLVETVLDKSSTQILLTSTAQTVATFACDRCVSPFDTRLSSSYSMLYVSEESDTEQLEPTEVQIVSVGLNGIDIAEDVRQTLLLAVPLKLLCRESCKGLCPHCGRNLNESTCSCSEPTIDSRWEKLRKLQSN